MIWRAYFTQENILSYGLAFVTVWFGVNEIFYPDVWVGFIPGFLAIEGFRTALVIAHGMILTFCGILLALNYYRAGAAGVLAIMLAGIVIHLTWIGIYDIAVRDFGLLTIAVILAMKREE